MSAHHDPSVFHNDSTRQKQAYEQNVKDTFVKNVLHYCEYMFPPFKGVIDLHVFTCVQLHISDGHINAP